MNTSAASEMTNSAVHQMTAALSRVGRVHCPIGQACGRAEPAPRPRPAALSYGLLIGGIVLWECHRGLDPLGRSPDRRQKRRYSRSRTTGDSVTQPRRTKPLSGCQQHPEAIEVLVVRHGCGKFLQCGGAKSMMQEPVRISHVIGRVPTVAMTKPCAAFLRGQA